MSSLLVAKVGPRHFTGNAPSKSQARKRWPDGPIRVMAAVLRLSLFPCEANCSPEDLFSHARVREELGMRPGGFGILLAKRLVDELIYNEKGNEVVLVKYLSPLD